MEQCQPKTIKVERQRYDAVVLENEPICQEHYRLRLGVRGEKGGKFPATKPGQFIQLGCRLPREALDVSQMRGRDIEWQLGEMPALRQPELCGSLALLRRPFSLSSRGENQQGSWIEIIHRVVGVGTDWLSQVKQGDLLDFIGPLGQPFDLSKRKGLGLLVGGGVGLPPMFYLAESLAALGWDAVGFVGALNGHLLAAHFDQANPASQDGTPSKHLREFAQHGFSSVITTDDGSVGLKGRITVGLEKYLAHLSKADLQRVVIFTCGPHVMMRAVAELAKNNGLKCQVCMEQAMACGMGTCQSCVVRIEKKSNEIAQGQTDSGRGWRYKLACTDGPVFKASQIIW